MELSPRTGHDRFLSHSPLAACEALRLQIEADRYTAAVVYPFDPFTEVGPFLGYSARTITAGPWVVGAMLQRAGVTARVVQQVWNPNFQAQRATINGRPIDILAISAMNIHAGKAQALIRDASLMGPARPLVVCGGPKYIYQPTDAWRGGPDLWPDVVVTGETHVLISLLQRVSTLKRGDETLAQACRRVRDDGGLQDIPGLMYRIAGDDEGLVHTGTARLSPNLERPFSVEGLQLYERPGRHGGLSPAPMSLREIGTQVSAIITPGITEGCTETCGFCPIPARMQRSYRTTSHEFISEDFLRVLEATGIRDFAVGDDSHFNSKHCETFWAEMAQVRHKGQPLRGQIRIATEAVLAHVKKRLHVLPDASLGGLNTLWFGIETFNTSDLDKGQNTERTEEVFAALRRQGIGPMAMTILFEGQQWRGNATHPFGIAETMTMLDRCGASYMQMTHISPSPGSRFYEGHFTSGEVLAEAGAYQIDDRFFDGNRVILDFSRGKDPRSCARRQLLILGAYWKFYGPLRLLRLIGRYLREPTALRSQDVRMCAIGMAQTAVSTMRYAPWVLALWRGPWRQYAATPELKAPIRSSQAIRPM